MFEIISRKNLNSTVTQMEIYAPLVVKRALPGQFVILRTDSDGERIPLTIAGTDKEKGSVRIIFQVVGATTEKLNHKNKGDCLHDFVGPLGKPTVTDGIKSICIIGGGVGCAIALPLAEEFHNLGCNVTSVIGFRSKDLLILEDNFRSVSDRLTVMTDDGSYGRQGNVTLPLKEMLDDGMKFDLVMAIGPLVMMKYVTLTAKPYNIPVRVSMNSIMIDGTGMCGCCRVTVIRGGKKNTEFACVDGPEFSGYEIDFDDALSRGRMYSHFEKQAHEHVCNLYRNS